MNKRCLTLALLCSFNLTARPANAQSGAQALDKFPFEETTPLKIARDAIPSHPFTVVGPRGAILGAQDGSFDSCCEFVGHGISSPT